MHQNRHLCELVCADYVTIPSWVYTTPISRSDSSDALDDVDGFLESVPTDSLRELVTLGVRPEVDALEAPNVHCGSFAIV